MAHRRKKIIDITSAIIFLALIALDAAIWKNIFSVAGALSGTTGTARIYFLSVTQGEAALLVLPDNTIILTDAGPDIGIVHDLQEILPSGAPPYIDLAIISYPQTADYEGYQYLLQHYQVGAFIYNGRADDAKNAEWQALMTTIAAKHIPLVTLGAGDRIRDGTAAEIDILSPDATFARSPQPSDTGIVQRVTTPRFTALLAADIGTGVEDRLLERANDNHASLGADILKAPFPGLGTTAGDAFLRAVAPRTIVIAPGVKGTASQPTKTMRAHLASSTNAAIVSADHGSFLLYNK